MTSASSCGTWQLVFNLSCMHGTSMSNYRQVHTEIPGNADCIQLNSIQ